MKKTNFSLFIVIFHFSLLIFFVPLTFHFSLFTFNFNEAHAALIGKPPTNLGLVGYWSMNEGTGTVAGDGSGNGNQGVLTGGPTWVDGKRGKALNFDGVNDYVNAGSDASLDKIGLGARTVTAWINARSLGEGNFGRIIDKNQGGAVGWLLYLCNSDSCVNGFRFNQTTTGTNNDIYDARNVLTFNKWIHVAFTYSGTVGTPAIFYIDGKSVTVSTRTTGDGSLDDDSANVATIGGSTPTDRTFDGLIDEVRVYNRALSATEIQALYKSGATKFASAPTNLGLVGYWSMNEGTGSYAGDSSGNGNQGTLTSGPTWVDGKRDKALNFDGVNALVNLASPATLDNVGGVNGPRSVVAWIYPKGWGDGSLGRIWDKGSSPNGWLFYIKNDAAPLASLVIQVGATTAASAFSAANTIALNQWFFVAGTWAGTIGTNAPKLYVGSPSSPLAEVSYYSTNAGSGTPGDDNANNATIGDRNAADRSFNGLIDEVRVYNRALSAAEIQALYQADYAKINAPQNNQITNGLVGLWSFNGPDMSGATAYDRSGQGNNGTLTNGPTRAAGKVGQGLSFDVVNDYVEAADSASLRVGVPSFTFSAWLNPGSVSSCSTGGAGCMVFNKENSYEWGIDNQNIVWWAIRNTSPGWAWVSSGLSAPTNTWTHIVITYNGSNIITYKNGGASTNSQSGSGNVDNTTYQNALRIGARGAPSAATAFFPGLIDEPRIYNRVLTPAEIKRLYNMGR